MATVSRRQPGEILGRRLKGSVVWEARIGHDRGRLEVVGLVPASTHDQIIEMLTERELRELLDEREA